MRYLLILTTQILDQQILCCLRRIEARAKDLSGRSTNIIVVACGKGQQRRRLDCVFLVCGRARARGYGAALRGHVLGIVNRC